MPSNELKLHVVFDNESHDTTTPSLWGFAAVIETPQATILFDTGSNGRVLLKNLHAQGVAVETIDTLFISHAHWDHIGGLDSILELNPTLDIYLTQHLSKNLIRDLKSLARSVTIIGDTPTQILPNIYSTGAMGEASEQSMIIQTKEGLVVIAGCAHSGIEAIVQRAQTHLNQSTLLLLGGFHLFDKTATEIQTIIQHLQALGTHYVAPSHCTGSPAKVLFANAFQTTYIDGGLGLSLTINQGKIT